ncbi:FtsH protease activity modulator HflK, partial [Rhodospirillum rubrum]
PWGSGGRGGNGRGFGGGSGGQPPDLEEMLRRSQERFRKMVPGGNLGNKGIGLVVILALAVWLLTGFYRVGTDEQGVVMRFGEFTHTTPPGLHYHLPYPIEAVILPKVTVENRIELGFRGIGENARGRTPSRDVLEESLMLTGDENIIDIDFSVIWVIKDAGAFLFNLRDPEGTVNRAAESAMREVIGQTPIQVALTEGRQQIEDRTKELLQAMMDEYNAGITIRRVQLLKVDPPAQVVDAFNDVQRSRADRERLRNEAEAYRNSVIPEARGQAEQLLQQAEAYREEIVNRAQGDVARFNSVLEGYRLNRDVTTQRIYLETMEEVLRNVNKVIIDKNGQGVVPYLPLPEVRARQGGAATIAPSGQSGAPLRPMSQPAPGLPAAQGGSR